MTVATAPQPTKPTIGMDELVKKFIQLRDKKSQLKAEYEATVAPLTELQDKIEALLLQRFQEMGVESIRTPEGTAYTTVHTSATVADWDAFLAFVKSHDSFEMIERRVSKAAVEQYKAAHSDLPPGLNWAETRSVNFRRS